MSLREWSPPPPTVEQALAIELTPIVTDGLRNPLYVTHAGDGSGRLFVLEQPGRIRVVEYGRLRETPFLDISSRVLSGGEQGLLGLAFHPDYRRNGRFMINYNRDSDGATVLAEYRVSDNRNLATQDEKLLMVVPQPYANHNGGMVGFGPDGFLYIARGDGGAGGDPGNRAQNRQELLGKILRIDVVRQGANYGWRVMEGNHCFSPSVGCLTTGLAPPVAEYRNQRPRCSITGGYVYRGTRIPGLVGTYVYGDYCSGEVFGLSSVVQSASGVLNTPRVLLSTRLKISSFGEDQDGELYVVGHAGTVHRL